MNVPTDVYEYLGQFVEDKDILNMLSVNKKFNDPIFFERALRRKYPFLLEFKSDRVTWRQFYISMIYYIAKMKEQFSDVPVEDFNPRQVQGDSLYWETALKSAVDSGNIELTLFFINNFPVPMGYLLAFMAPKFLNQPMANFLKNANFTPILKELLRPLLDIGILNGSILNLSLVNYFVRNNLRVYEGKKVYYIIDEDIKKYLGPYLNDFEVGTKLPVKFISKIVNLSIMALDEMNQEQRNFIVTAEMKKLLFGLRRILSTE